MNIGTYLKLRQLLKSKSIGYRPNKTAVFSPEAIRRFLNEAPNKKFLDIKVNFNQKKEMFQETKQLNKKMNVKKIII